jgi:hypothetical protein
LGAVAEIRGTLQEAESPADLQQRSPPAAKFRKIGPRRMDAPEPDQRRKKPRGAPEPDQRGKK